MLLLLSLLTGVQGRTSWTLACDDGSVHNGHGAEELLNKQLSLQGVKCLLKSDDEGDSAGRRLTAPGAAFTAALTPAGGSTFLVVGHTVPTAAPGLPAGIQVGLWTGDMDTPPGWALVEGTAGMEALDADWHGDTLYVANAGDSRAVISRAGAVGEGLTHDHKPEDEKEMARITAIGGIVDFGGVVAPGA